MKKDKKENEKDTHFYSILAILAIVIIHRLYMATGLTFLRYLLIIPGVFVIFLLLSIVE